MCRFAALWERTVCVFVWEWRVCSLNMNWQRWHQTTGCELVLLTKGWESERRRDACQADRAAHWHTFSGRKNRDLLLFSHSHWPPSPPFNHTYYDRLISMCEPTILYSDQFLLGFILFLVEFVLESYSGKWTFSSPHSTLVLISSINLLQQHIYFHSNTFCHRAV